MNIKQIKYELQNILSGKSSQSYDSSIQAITSYLRESKGTSTLAKDQLKNKVEETKKRLDTVFIDEASSDGQLKITLTANRTIKAIEIDDTLLEDKEQLEDYLILTLNKAITKATSVNEAELSAVAKEGMPNIPGMDMF